MSALAHLNRAQRRQYAHMFPESERSERLLSEARQAFRDLDTDRMHECLDEVEAIHAKWRNRI